MDTLSASAGTDEYGDILRSITRGVIEFEWGNFYPRIPCLYDASSNTSNSNSSTSHINVDEFGYDRYLNDADPYNKRWFANDDVEDYDEPTFYNSEYSTDEEEDM
jgi:hypothetical protein